MSIISYNNNIFENYKTYAKDLLKKWIVLFQIYKNYILKMLY